MSVRNEITLSDGRRLRAIRDDVARRVTVMLFDRGVAGPTFSLRLPDVGRVAAALHGAGAPETADLSRHGLLERR